MPTLVITQHQPLYSTPGFTRSHSDTCNPQRLPFCFYGRKEKSYSLLVNTLEFPHVECDKFFMHAQMAQGKTARQQLWAASGQAYRFPQSASNLSVSTPYQGRGKVYRLTQAEENTAKHRAHGRFQIFSFLSVTSQGKSVVRACYRQVFG